MEYLCWNEWLLVLGAGRKERKYSTFVVSPDNNFLAFLGNDGYVILVSNKVSYTVEPPIKDTPNKEHLSIKNKSPCPNVSFILRFHCTYCIRSVSTRRGWLGERGERGRDV